MGDHENGLAEALIQVFQQLKHCRGILAVEVSGRFVGQQDGWTVHNGPRWRYRFGAFEVDSTTGELRRNRLRDALGDKAVNPRFIETLARRGYRFLAPVECIGSDDATPAASPELPDELQPGFLDRMLATPEDLPKSSHIVVQTLFLLMQIMYLGFYVGALANLAEINELFSVLPYAAQTFALMIVTAAVMIPVRAFLLCAVLFHAPGIRAKYLKIWWYVLPLDGLWALAPFLLLHHINSGLALACMTLLVYSPFAQRSLVLMGAGTDRS
jgi:hypothetical protein